MGLPSLPLTWWAEESRRAYRYRRLSNRAHAAAGSKCRYGPLGRRDIKIYRKCKVLFPYSTGEKSFCAERGSGSGERRTSDSMRNLFVPQLQLDEREIQRPWVFGGVLFHISFAVERNMAARGIHAGRGCSPQSENEQRAVGDAGPYAVRHCRAEHGSGSGSCHRVPEPVIVRHPRGAWERQRLLSPSPGACHSTPPARCVGAAAI